jgi:hypothetical protein
LDTCIVNLCAPQTTTGKSLEITALHIYGLKRSIVLAPFVQGSALLYDCDRCIVVVGCHQFRMHNSTNCDIYLHVNSLPVVECCKGMRFAPYTLPYPASMDPQASKYRSVQDFDWIRSGPSPNWSLLPSEEVIGSNSEVAGWPLTPRKVEDSIDNLLSRNSS